MSHFLEDSQVYPVYAALESGTLLSLLPELERWQERFLQELRQAGQQEAQRPEEDAATHEILNEARAAVLNRADCEGDTEVAEAWRSLLPSIDQIKVQSSLDSDRFRESAATYVRHVATTLQDLRQRRLIAIKVLCDRGILPRALGD